MSSFAVILARGGSVGIPKKNMTIVAGMPLLYWSIKAAWDSQVVKRVYVSSDDDEILDFASSELASPIKRPSSLSGSEATSESGWAHALTLIEEAEHTKYFFALQPTSPIRDGKDFDLAYSSCEANSYDSMFSAEVIKDHYIWGSMHQGLAPDNFVYKERGMRQSLADKYLENGSFYLLNIRQFLASGVRHFGKIGVYPMPKYKSVQIDNPEDVLITEALMEKFEGYNF